MNEIVDIITCARCSLEKPAHKHNRHLCEECVKAENNRVAFFRQQNADWMEIAKEADLELWERQPGETDREWSVWLRYRDIYPAAKPSYRTVAEDLNTTINVVKKVGQRWSFPIRLQAWAKYIDGLTLQQRKQEVLAMNEQHINMARTINGKLEQALALLDPANLSPSEIKGLYKTAVEIERKARLDMPDMSVNISDSDNPELKKNDIKSDDINDILSILGQAGALDNIKRAGVRQTVTTEVVVDGDDSSR